MTRPLAPMLLSAALLACSRAPEASTPEDINVGPAVNLGRAINGPTFDGGPSITADGLALYFASDRAGGHGGSDLWVATRSTLGAAFGSPRNLGAVVNSAANESAPEIAGDGLTLYFDSDRPRGRGSYDIWVTRRVTVDHPYGAPENLGPVVNTPASEGHPSLSSDGLTLYFQGRGPGGFGDADIWMAMRANATDPFERVVNLGSGVNSPFFDGEPSISADGLALLFSSDRPGGLGARDLWAAERSQLGGSFRAPRNLGTDVNSTAQDVTPNVAHDGAFVYFMSDRPGGVGGLDLWSAPLSRPPASPRRLRRLHHY